MILRNELDFTGPSRPQAFPYSNKTFLASTSELKDRNPGTLDEPEVFVLPTTYSFVPVFLVLQDLNQLR